MRSHNSALDVYRAHHPTLPDTRAGDMFGFFLIPCGSETLRVISDGGSHLGWEHVSVSLHYRTPTWKEMQTIKELFWGAEETVVQFHPKRSKYVNKHEYTLHLWKQTGHDHQLPPQECV